MNSNKTKYLVIVEGANQEQEQEPGETNPVAQAFYNTTAVCNTVKKAYQIGMWLAGVNNPTHTYRKTADTVRDEGIVWIADKSDPNDNRIMITKVRWF